ncbi:VanW family protein [Candidatus Woesebacteria bacterium]|nr:VanW family protein [Candidatus Woesebacteria bacterium]
MKKLQQQPKSHLLKIALFFGIGILCGVALLVGVARFSWHSKFYPGVTIAKVAVGGLKREETKEKIVEKIDKYQTNFSFNGVNWKTPTNSAEYLVDASLNEAYRYGRRFEVQDYLLLLINKKTNYPLVLAEGRTEKIETMINEIAGVVEIAPVEAEVRIAKQTVTVTNGSDGVVIDGTMMDSMIRERQANLDENPIAIPTKTVKTQLSEDQLMQLKTRAEKLVGKSLTLKLDDEKIVIVDKDLVTLLSKSGEQTLFNHEAIKEYVVGLSPKLNKEPQDARFEFEDGKVKEFAPGKDGVVVNLQFTISNLQTGIEKLLNEEVKTETIEIAAERTPPKVTTEKVNELGIKERIGRGESYYTHSIPNRIYNVALASSRINSALIPPGEEVSFNKLVGEVSGATGYREAYIISGGRTVLGDGGGLCQVSTTMFRAAMSAGLPILERWGHAYRVSYYELNSKPGVDATVIAPSKDFRFKNDTPGHILIQTINDPKALHLVIEIYGTSDGRVATTTEPKVWGITAPLPTIYQDDPSLPAGTMKQVDWAASGARASFEYKVVRNGETIQDKTFSTVYRAWASVFLRGTGI